MMAVAYRFQLVTGRTWRGSAFGGVKGRTEIPGLVEGESRPAASFRPPLRAVLSRPARRVPPGQVEDRRVRDAPPQARGDQRRLPRHARRRLHPLRRRHVMKYQGKPEECNAIGCIWRKAVILLYYVAQKNQISILLTLMARNEN